MSSVLIESLANGGDGVGRLEDGRAAFVRATAPGDRIEVDIREDHGNWVAADVRRILEPSADRVTPPCPYFGSCGGCQWQHVAMEAQLAGKRRIVEDSLRRIGRIDVSDGLVRPCVPSPEVYGYRNKIELITGTTGGRFSLGFSRIASNELVPIDRCMLLPERSADVPRKLAGSIRYLSGSRDLAIGRIGIRSARNSGDVEIALWTPPSAFPRGAVGPTLANAVGATSVVRVLAKVGRESHPAKVEVLAGRGAWRERLKGVELLVSAPSFFQVNTKQAERLIDLVLDVLAPDGTDRVADVYAGAGTFTLPLASCAGSVTAVEASGAAIRDLRRNLDSAGLDAVVEPGDAGRVLPELGAFDLAVVDPPRAGLTSEALRALVVTRARSIAYVSCDAATLARDARALVDAGYSLVSVTPVDLFPQTYHVETVSHFERNPPR